MKQKQRTIREIALDVRKNWKNVNPAAKPYLDAMFTLETINDKYAYTDGKSIVLYFLSNAGTFRGDAARQIKQELKNLK